MRRALTDRGFDAPDGRIFGACELFARGLRAKHDRLRHGGGPQRLRAGHGRGREESTARRGGKDFRCARRRALPLLQQRFTGLPGMPQQGGRFSTILLQQNPPYLPSCNGGSGTISLNSLLISCGANSLAGARLILLALSPKGGRPGTSSTTTSSNHRVTTKGRSARTNAPNGAGISGNPRTIISA